MKISKLIKLLNYKCKEWVKKKKKLYYSYNIIEIASFKILSPKIKIYKILSTPISLKIPNTATVSVADIKDPKAKHILNVNCLMNNKTYNIYIKFYKIKMIIIILFTQKKKKNIFSFTLFLDKVRNLIWGKKYIYIIKIFA